MIPYYEAVLVKSKNRFGTRQQAIYILPWSELTRFRRLAKRRNWTATMTKIEVYDGVTEMHDWEMDELRDHPEVLDAIADV